MNPEKTSESVAKDELVVGLMQELREQRKAFQEERQALSRERKSERRWGFFFKFMLFVVPFLLGAFYTLHLAGIRIGPIGEVVGVVHIEGEIKATSPASADKIIPSLERAFAAEKVRHIVLAIDSPGGAPVESERIIDAIAFLKKKFPKPVTAVISNVGASAAYMIAMHADKVVAGKYSLVGSIGAIIAPWQLDRAIAKLNINQRIYASGKLKAFLNPFTPVTTDADAKAQALVDQVGRAFMAELVSARGGKLRKDVDYQSGEVWSGAEAKELGLIDTIGTIDDVSHSMSDLKSYDFGPYQDGFGQLRTLFSSTISASIHDTLFQSGGQLR